MRRTAAARFGTATTRLARVLCFVLTVVNIQAHFASQGNILRVQLWDEDGLTKVLKTSPTSLERKSSSQNTKRVSIKVDDLMSEMYNTINENGKSVNVDRYTRNKIKHGRKGKHRYKRIKKHLGEGEDEPYLWKFHSDSNMNIKMYDNADEIISVEYRSEPINNISQVHYNNNSNESVSGTLAQEEKISDDELEIKKVAIVPKCCPVGENYSAILIEGKRVCAPTILTFQPFFYETNTSHIWPYEGNLFENIVGNPCEFGKYKLDPEHSSSDEFYLYTNGTILVMFDPPKFIGVKSYCMESFWSETSPGGDTRPLVCFESSPHTSSVSNSFTFYASGLLISVPLLLITALIYTLIPELRDPHGLALACHTTCMAAAFSCLAATQLSGETFQYNVCRIIAFLIQFTFLSCFFWLNVMCFDTWLNVKRYLLVGTSKQIERKRFVYYSIYAISIPVIILAVTLVMDLAPDIPIGFIKPNFGSDGCWFKSDRAALPYFYGPVACLLLSNVVIFFLTSRAFAKHYDKLTNFTVTDLTTPSFGSSQDWMRLSEVLDAAINNRQSAASSTSSPQREHHNNFKQRWRKYRKLFRLCCILSFVMGISWILEVISWVADYGDGPSIWTLFDVINSLQGLVIFCVFVLQAPVRGLVWKRIRFKCSRCCESKTAENSATEMVTERTMITCDTNDSSKASFV